MGRLRVGMLLQECWRLVVQRMKLLRLREGLLRQRCWPMGVRWLVHLMLRGRLLVLLWCMPGGVRRMLLGLLLVLLRLMVDLCTCRVQWQVRLWSMLEEARRRRGLLLGLL